MAFYEKLADSNATDWTARRERAKAYANVGFIQLHYRNLPASEKAYRQALDLMEQLAEEKPLDFDNRFNLAYDYHWSYRVYLDSGRLQPAEKMTRHALSLFDELAADFPNRTVEIQEPKAYSLRNLGHLLAKSAKPQEAEQAFQKSIAIWTDLAAAHPKATGYRNALAYDYGVLGDLFRQTGRVSQAVDVWRRAVLILEKVVVETNNSDSRWQMAGWNERLAAALAEAGEPQGAEELYRKAVSI